MGWIPPHLAAGKPEMTNVIFFSNEYFPKIEGFDVLVCNCFKPKVIHDQLCYEVDLKRFGKEENRENELKHGLILLLDLNEERQSFEGEIKMNDHTNFQFGVQIHLDTISKI